MQAAFAAFFARAGAEVARAARGVGKAAGGADDDHDAVQAVEALDYDTVHDEIVQPLKRVAQSGAQLGLEQVGADIHQLLAQANKRAIAWAQGRAAELVTQIDETTRELVRAKVAEALEDGWTNDELADAIAEDEAFGGARAQRIARTETAFADVAGNLEGWRASGRVAAKRWIVADANECDLCAELDGEEVALDEEFPGEGGDGPPLHPNCRCDVLPVVSEDEE